MPLPARRLEVDMWYFEFDGKMCQLYLIEKPELHLSMTLEV
jgi:hypothetical protein